MRDFSLIFDALTTFEEALLAARMGAEEQAPDDTAPADGSDFMLYNPGSDMDLRCALAGHTFQIKAFNTAFNANSQRRSVDRHEYQAVQPWQ